MLSEAEKYNLFLENLPDAHASHRVIWSEAGYAFNFEFISVNKAFEELVGASKEEIVGKNIEDVLSSLHYLGFDWFGLCEKALSEKRRILVEAYSEPLKRWYEVTALYIEDNYLITVLRDITRYKRIENQLQESQMLLRKYIDDAPMGIHVIDTEGYIIDANPRGYWLLGYTRKELIGLNVCDIADKNWVENFKDILQELRQYGYASAEVLAVTSEEEQRWFDLYGVKLNKNLQLTFFIDITERKKAEENLQKSEEKFRTLFDKSSNAIMIHDKDTGEILDANEVALETYGYNSLEELKKDTFKQEPPYSFNEALEKIQKTSLEGPQQFEWLTMTKNGDYIWEEVRTNCINIDGEECVLGTGINITERKQLEKNQRHFIQLCAHELRNPMTGIRGIFSLVRNRLEKDQPSKNATKLLSHAEREIDRLSNIVNQIMAVFKEQAEQSKELNYKWQAVELGELLSRVVIAAQPMSSNHKIELDMNVEGEVWINGDPERLEDVLRNLISNAVKFTPENKKIVISMQNEKDWAVIEVQDEGVGIPEEHLDHVFKSFFRSENFIEKDPGGMGLGLYLSKEIINRHGGSIWAENNPGRGSTFYIKLPIYYPEKGDWK